MCSFWTSSMKSSLVLHEHEYLAQKEGKIIQNQRNRRGKHIGSKFKWPKLRLYSADIQILQFQSMRHKLGVHVASPSFLNLECCVWQLHVVYVWWCLAHCFYLLQYFFLGFFGFGCGGGLPSGTKGVANTFNSLASSYKMDRLSFSD